MSDVVVRSVIRAGRLVRSEREEDGGRIQGWVLAGEKGAAEMRGTGPARLVLLVHRPSASAGEFLGHGFLNWAEPDTFPDARCTVLEGPCMPSLVIWRIPDDLDLTDPWELLATVYRAHLEVS